MTNGRYGWKVVSLTMSAEIYVIALWPKVRRPGHVARE